jgi:hypothetical protein
MKQQLKALKLKPCTLNEFVEREFGELQVLTFESQTFV